VITYTKIPDLSRTAAAIEAYDAFDATFEMMKSNESVLAWFAKQEELGQAVGLAFGLDTADRNNPDTCRQVVRPGPKVPSPGFEKSFVRALVEQWQKQEAK
jgi:hypothetical protein